MRDKINLPDAFKRVDGLWDPHIAGQVNGSDIRIARIKGTFDWHTHDKEDEAFYVVKGEFSLEMRDCSISMQEGDLFVVPRGTEHRPVATEECWIMLIEPGAVVNTGNVLTEKTKTTLKYL